jgi:hypothetical protein
MTHQGGTHGGEVTRRGRRPRRRRLHGGGGSSTWEERKARVKVWGTTMRGGALFIVAVEGHTRARKGETAVGNGLNTIEGRAA